MALVNTINQSEDPNKKDLIEIIHDFIDACKDYVDKVIDMEKAMNVARFHMEPDAYREYVMHLDRGRRMAHESLISSIKTVNRFARQFQMAMIYDGPEERIAMGDFALEVVGDFFKERKL